LPGNTDENYLIYDYLGERMNTFENPNTFGFSNDSLLLDVYGADSDVWKIGNHVKKIYTYLSTELITTYKDVTDRSRKYLLDTPEIFLIQKPDETIPCRVYINPILSVSTISTKNDALWPSRYVTADSPFVAGPQVGNLSMQSEQFHNAVSSLDGKEAGRLIRFHKERKQTQDLTLITFDEYFRVLSQKLNTAAGVEGISIIPMNVKLRYPSKDGGIQFIVTDLCRELRLLKNT
jgi:hypothetical protein